MRREQRLRRRRDFAAAYRVGRSQGNHLLVLRIVRRDPPDGPPRFGFVTGKVVGNAVTRNRVKRRLRAIARDLTLPDGLDVVIGTRKAAGQAASTALRRSLLSLLERARVPQSRASEMREQA